MVAGDGQHPRRALLEEIDKKSSLLLSQLSDFKNVIRDRKIVSFYEQSQTPALLKDPETKSWSRSGDYATAVEPDSAVLHLPDSMETRVPLDLDHSHMVKFDSKRAEGYRSALHYLSEFARDAPRVVAARFSRQQTKIKSLSTVPFRRDPNFVGREDILAKLDADLSLFTTHKRIGLVGLGGMRKSQIAIEFSYRVRLKLPQTWVFWVHASTVTRFEQSYRNIADALELPNREDPKTDIFQLVSRWLTNENNGPWLLIVDNADDANMFSSVMPVAVASPEIDNSKSLLLAHIPQTSHGSVLITSRNRASAYKLTGDHADIISISSMDENEGLSLLAAKLVNVPPVSDFRELLIALDHIPLTIMQAAAYIANGAPRMTIQRYLELFNENEINRSSLLEEDLGDLRRDPEVPNAVITTWQVSFNQILRDHPAAADLLSLMSVLNRQGIPEYLLVQEIGDQMRFETALAPLLAFSLVNVESNRDSYNLHRLVQLATRKWLEVHGEIMKWNRSALWLISRVFPIGDYENWCLCGALLPHAEAVLSYDLQTKDDLLQRSCILHDLSWYFWMTGDYQLSMSNIMQALEIKNQYLNEKDQSRLGTLSMFALVLDDGGRHNEAEAVYRQVLRLLEETSSEKHPDTLATMNNLALVLCGQGKYGEAEAMQRKTLKLQKEVLGGKSPETLAGRNNLATVLGYQGKYDEAEAIHRQVLTLSEEVRGEKHPNTLISMNNLALVLNRQGKYDEAEAMQRNTLKLREETLGGKHPKTLLSVQNLAFTLYKTESHIEASILYRRACSGFETALGPAHPDTVACTDHYSAMLAEIGEIDKVSKLTYTPLR